MEPLDPVLARGRAAAKGACRKRPLVWGEAESPAVRKGPSRRGGVQATGSRPDCGNEAPAEMPTHSPPRPSGLLALSRPLAASAPPFLSRSFAASCSRAWGPHRPLFLLEA